MSFLVMVLASRILMPITQDDGRVAFEILFIVAEMDIARAGNINRFCLNSLVWKRFSQSITDRQKSCYNSSLISMVFCYRRYPIVLSPCLLFNQPCAHKNYTWVDSKRPSSFAHYNDRLDSRATAKASLHTLFDCEACDSSGNKSSRYLLDDREAGKFSPFPFKSLYGYIAGTRGLCATCSWVSTLLPLPACVHFQVERLTKVLTFIQ